MTVLPAGRSIYTFCRRRSFARATGSAGCYPDANSAAYRNFYLRVSYLRYANSALLRRNIIAFHSPEQAYFACKRFAGLLPASKTRGTTMFASIVRFFREWRRYNQSLSELSRLGDRELADIGISRSEIQRVAWTAAHQR
jgi:uncharacterized protein YjiS (DUF1127 family)